MRSQTVRIFFMGLFCIAVSTLCCEDLFGQTSSASFDEQARFLAGMSVPDSSPLKKLEDTAVWKEHAAVLSGEWTPVEKRRLSVMRGWAESEVRKNTSASLPVFYMFSGPDFVSVNSLYPKASAYILCGLEPVGKLPAIEKMSPEKLRPDLKNLIVSLKSIFRISFFRTIDMEADFRKGDINGLLPVLYIFVARTGNHIQSMDYINLDPEGKVWESSALKKEEGKSYPHGVRIRFYRENPSQTQELYYFQQNLLNVELQKVPGFLKFLESQGKGVAYLKAASYLMHAARFSSIRSFLVDNSLSVLEDDTGIPFRFFPADKWTRTIYGNYFGPIKLFENYFQPELKKAYNEQKEKKAISFLTGYNKSNGAHLIYALKKNEKVDVVAASATAAVSGK